MERPKDASRQAAERPLTPAPTITTSTRSAGPLGAGRGPSRSRWPTAWDAPIRVPATGRGPGPSCPTTQPSAVESNSPRRVVIAALASEPAIDPGDERAAVDGFVGASLRIL